ncbi:hypothetical protein GLOIN_2v1479662 [Rhizophagus irregularis DAOM 181602=DAOM 197198]|nr:hypothetical protein GLOIN_2v1479662 [Rhizophagus irregularis DAOM 181602=DAOM 197198]
MVSIEDSVYKFPDELVNLLTELFLERKNKVFTPGGLTEEYDVQCGIDQGEIISPLLWIIYYDPLLSKIKNSGLGYNIDGKRVLNLYENIDEKVELNFPGLSYMDDTNFLSENKADLEKILEIADSFYNINDIKINKEKSELLWKTKKGHNMSEIVKIKFGNKDLIIKPADKKGSVRILGVWFNAYNRREHVIAQIREEVRNCCETMILRKKLSDKQMSFIFNVLIIPKIEYHAQMIILTEEECNSLIAPFRMLYKNKIGLARTAPNALMHTREFYNLKNFSDNQLQAKITNFIIQINDNNELGQVTRIRLYNLQELLLLVDDPLSSLTVNDIISHGFDVKNNNNSTKNLMKVPGGNVRIKDIIDSENNRKIKKEIYDKLSHGLAKNLKGTDIKPVAVDPLSWKSFVAVVGSNSKVIYGKKYNTMNGWIIMEHFEVLSNPMDMSIVMRKCEGCALNERDKLSNEYLYKNSSCLLASRTDCTFYLENIKNSKGILMKSSESYIITEFIQEHFEGFLLHDSIFSCNPYLHGWDDAILIENNYEFNNIKSLEKVYIYIDGSVINSGTENIEGLAGINIYDNEHNFIDEMYFSIENWISPIKAETAAFLIALIIAFNVENVKIFTDSENVYRKYYNIVKENSIYGARKILKEENNIYMWALIRQMLVKDKIIVPTLIKIKAHADNVYHNLLDKNIKEKYGDLDRVYSINVNYSNIDDINYVVIWNNIVIEKRLRHFIRQYTDVRNFEQFLNLQRNAKYRKNQIDWYITFEYLKEKEGALVTSLWTSKRRRKKMQKLIEEIPTIEHCKKSLFDLFKDWKCPRCEKKKETFNHVWRCKSQKKMMMLITKNSFEFLFKEISDLNCYEIKKEEFLKFFQEKTYCILSEDTDNLTFIDVIKGLFPLDITKFLIDIKINKDHRMALSVSFLEYVYDETFKIWEDRCEVEIKKEKAFRINRAKKMSTKSYDPEYKNRLDGLTTPLYNRAEGLLAGIYFNKKPLDFTVFVNRIMFSFF